MTQTVWVFKLVILISYVVILLFFCLFVFCSILKKKQELTIRLYRTTICSSLTPPGGGGTLGNSWWERATWLSKSLPYFRPQKCHFPHLLSDQTSETHTRFQTWPFKCISNSHISLSFILIGIETINTFIHSRSSLENHTRFQTEKAPKPCRLRRQ